MSLALTATDSPDRIARWAPIAAFVALLALSLAPTLLVEIPAMVDYPNHLARMSILARAGTPEASPFYDVAWRLYPNLAMDLIVPPLARQIGAVAATKAFLVLSQILVVSGAVAIELAVKRRFSIAGFMALLYLHSWPFAFGFLNFMFALGLALWAVAIWIRLAREPAWLRLGAHAVFVLALYVSHLFALGLYGFAIGVIELRRSVADRAWGARDLTIYPMMAAPVALLGVAMTVLGGAVGGSGTLWEPQHKPITLNCVNGYNLWISMAITSALALGAYAGFREGWLRFERGGGWMAIGFAALFLAMPHRLFDTALIDVRVVVAAALIVPAFVTIAIPTARGRAAVAVSFGAVALANLAMVAAVQLDYAAEHRRMKQSFTLLGPNARILVAHGGDNVEPPVAMAEYPVFHMPVLAAHYANAFAPTLFAYPGKQPIVPRAEVQRIASLDSNLELLSDLTRVAREGAAADTPTRLADWTRDFDVLYIVGPLVENPLPGTLTPISEGRRYRAYRIGAEGARSGR